MALASILDAGRRPASPVPAAVPPGRERRLRVALVTGSYNGIKDGVALTLNRLVAYLERQGVQVLVFAPDGKPAFAHQGQLAAVPSVSLPLRPEYRLALGLPAVQRRRLQDFAPDVIHVATPDFMGHEAQRLARMINCPVVGSYHTRYETYLKHYGAGFLADAASRGINAFYERCREVYVPSASMAEALCQSGVRCDVRLWPRGVDHARFDPARRSQAWRMRRGFGDDELVVAFVGRLVREKRLATYAQALALLRERGVPHRALVVGEGPDRGMIQAQAPGAVFTGFLDGLELATAYASSDLFVFPSDTETFGAVTLEAMASGLPTLCALATGSRSLVQEGVTGHLAAADDPAAFADLIEALAGDPARRLAMGRAARARSLGFSWDAAMAMLLARYEAVASAA